MPDIFHQLQIKADVEEVFRAVSTPEGINVWWTNHCDGEPADGSVYELFFAPGYDWRAVVSKCVPNCTFELTMTNADEDWAGLRVGFELVDNDGTVVVKFYNSGWAEANATRAGRCTYACSGAMSSMVRLYRTRIDWPFDLIEPHNQ
jgi:uncharacterized protein YndB with AHSA1/START domain